MDVLRKIYSYCNTNIIEICYLLELTFKISYYIVKETKVLKGLILTNFNLGTIFGRFCNEIATHFTMPKTTAHLGKTLYIIKVKIPELYFPNQVNERESGRILDNLTDFYYQILKDFNPN